MATSIKPNTIPEYRPCLDTRSDQVCRWASYGSRAYTGIQRKFVHAPAGPSDDKRSLIWFGGDGLKAGFTVSNVQSILALRKYRRGVTGRTLSFYKNKLKNISILKACEILARIGCVEDTLYRLCTDPISRSYVQCSPTKILDQEGWYDGSAWLCAALTPATKLGLIEFVGGPPSRWGVYKGSLFTLLLDRVAVMILLDGATADLYLRLEDYFPNKA